MIDIDYHAAVAKFGSQNKAADALGIPRTTFKERLRKSKEPPKQEEYFQLNTIVRNIINKDKDAVEGIRRVLFVTDSHDSPELDKERFKWIAYRAKHGKYDHLVHGGDFADFKSICSHVPNDTYGGRLKGRISDDVASMNEAAALLADGGKWTYLLGNHEHRAWIYEDKNPEVCGIIQHTIMSIPQSFGWETYLYGQSLTLYGVDFVHAVKHPTNAKRVIEGKTAAQQIANNAGRDTVSGHNHKFMVYPLERNNGANLLSICGGCSMPDGYTPDYIGHNRPEWAYGALELTIRNGRTIGLSFVPMAVLQGEYEAR